MGQLDGKVALVTGAARGQGRAHAIKLAQEGARIIALDACTDISTVAYPLPSRVDLDRTESLVNEVGGEIITGVVDVRDLAGMKKFLVDSVGVFGRLDIVSANAGISTFSPMLEMSEEVWQETIDVNLTGVWKTCKAAIPHILETGSGGSVIITSSSATSMISNNIGHYTASKHGLIGLMRVLAKEMAPHRIRVNTIHPTGVETPMIINDEVFRLFRPDLADPNKADFDAAARSVSALDTPYLDVQDVSAAVVYLAADSGRYITGTTLMLDAGGSLL
ncbi:SDR family mycofactocin-dependent oxidoreductase [Rhodococcus sp. 27YEA15]|uniref:mycofactocin-coupled SDR family oxidoreductase n=1 Tax=Rhodococcus sp. 27YEA15 TaxID=3156259 RepID=UPI003C7D682D